MDRGKVGGSERKIKGQFKHPTQKVTLNTAFGPSVQGLLTLHSVNLVLLRSRLIRFAGLDQKPRALYV